MARGAVRVEADNLVEVGNSAFGVLLGNECLAAAEERISVPGIKPDSFIKIGDRAVQVALAFPGQTAVRVDVDMAIAGKIRVRQRINADRLGQVGDGAIRIALLASEKATIVVSKRVLWIEANGVGIVGQRAVRIVLGLPGEGAGYIGGGAHGGALALVLDDARAAGDIAIRILGVAIIVRLHACRGGRLRDRHQRACHHRHDRS
jgi:hypothetical protein